MNSPLCLLIILSILAQIAISINSITPYIYEISIVDSSHSNTNNGGTTSTQSSMNMSNVTALSTGGTKIKIIGYGFSQNSTLGNQVFIDGSVICDIVTYYTTPNQIQCVVPPYNIINVPLTIKVIVDGNKQAIFMFNEIKLIFIYNPSSIQRVRSISYIEPYKPLRLELLPTQSTEKGQLFTITVGSYLCITANQNKLLTKDVVNTLDCTLPELPLGYYLLDFLLQNQGGLLIRANKCKNLAFGPDPAQPYKNAKEFEVSIHPIIQSINTNIASPYGNILNIFGYGFTDNTVVKYTNKTCEILLINSTNIICQIPEILTNFSKTAYSGNIGFHEILYKKLFPFVQRLSLSSPSSINITLALNPLPYTGIKPYTKLLKGFFKAPITSSYRFYCSAIEKTQVFLYNISEAVNRSAMETICQVTTGSFEDNYFLSSEQISRWIQLAAGGLYYMEIMLIDDGTDSDQLKIAVEIANNDSSNGLDFSHPHDLQEIELYAPFVPEIILINLINIDTWRSLIYLKLNDSLSPQIQLSSSNNDISNVFQNFFKTKILVNVSFSDIYNTSVNDYKNATNCVINLTFNDTPRANSLYIPELIKSSLKRPENSSIYYQYTLSQLQSPSSLFNGTYQLMLNSNKTVDIEIWRNNTEIAQIILNSLPVRKPFTVRTLIDDRERKKFWLEFSGNPGNMSLIQVNTSKLIGGSHGNTIKVNITKIFEGNANIFINPINEEYLITANDNPQITLQSNGINAVCAGVCDYVLLPQDSLPKVTDFTNNQPNLIFNLTNLMKIQAFGIDLVNNFDPTLVFQVFIGKNQLCPPNTFTFTLITPDNGALACTFDPNLLYAGSFEPVVFLKNYGFLPKLYDFSLKTPVNITLKISDINPRNGSILGFTLLNITGNGFPSDISLTNMSVRLGGNDCAIVYISLNLIQCRTPSAVMENNDNYSINLNFVQKADILVNIAQFQYLAEIPFYYQRNATALISSVIPRTLRPWVSTSTLIIVENMNYSSNYNIYLKNALGTYFNCTNPVLFIENSTIQCIFYQKSISMQFGEYSLYLSIDSQGYAINSNSIYIGSNITSIYPSIGSIYGGTLLTIKGNGFTDGMKVIIDDLNTCNIINGTLNQTYFQCMLNLFDTSKNNAQQAKISLIYGSQTMNSDINTVKFTFSSSSTYSATCADINKKNFSAGDSLNVDITASAMNTIVTVANLIASLSFLQNNQLFLNINATIKSDGKFSYSIPDLIPGTYNININVLPYGFLNLNYDTINISTTCGNLSPSEGSVMGNRITLTGKNFPVNITMTMNNGIQDVFPIIITNYTSTSIKFRIPSVSFIGTYNIVLMNSRPNPEIICTYNYKTKASATSSKLDYNYGPDSNGRYGLTYCGGSYTSSNPTDYELINVKTQEIVYADSPLLLSPNMILFKITDLLLQASKTQAVFSLKNQSSGQWFPYVYKSGEGYTNMTFVAANSIILTPTVSSVNVGEFGYGGGINLTISGSHLYTNPNLIKIAICHKYCKILSTSSTTIICEIPAFLTLNLLKNHVELQANYEEITYFANIFSNSNNKTLEELIRDRNLETYYYSDDSSHTCYVGYDFGENITAYIQEIGINLYDKYNYYSKFLNTSFEGSNDNVTWNIIMNLTNINDNINFYAPLLDENLLKPNYRYIRFNDKFSSTNCAIREFKIIGFIVNSDPIMSKCEIKLYFNESTENILDFLPSSAKTISFNENKTIFLRYITPNYVFLSDYIQGNMIIRGEHIYSNSQIYIGNNKCDSSVSLGSISCDFEYEKSDFSGNFHKISILNIFGRSISLCDNNFYIIESWANPITWDNQLPVEGASILIPPNKLILLDISPPALKMLIVEGVLMVKNEISTNIELIVEKLVVRKGGIFRAGGKYVDFIGNLTITLSQLSNISNSSLEDAVTMQYFPKVFAVYDGFLALKGLSRQKRWCKISKTAKSGDILINISNSCFLTWLQGDIIVITGSNIYSTEEVTLAQGFDASKGISTNSYFLSLKTPLKYDHECNIINNMFMCMEVAVITSNIIIRGDPKQAPNDKSGGYMMIDGFGGVVNSVIIRQILLQDMGQASNEAISALFFREIRTLWNSEIRRNTFKNCYNKGIVFQSSNNVNFTENVIYNVYGHGIHTLYGTEVFNHITYNLIFNVKISSIRTSYFDYDLSGIFLRNPQNFIENNVVSSSESYGYYLLFDSTPDESYVGGSICPSDSPALAFTDNEAHHTSWGGLNLDTWGGSWRPLVKPCKLVNLTTNPDVISYIMNFKAWNIRYFGIMLDSIGQIKLYGAQIADCGTIGVMITGFSLDSSQIIRFKDINDNLLDFVVISQSLFIGTTDTNNAVYINANGIGLPQMDGAVFSNITFINYLAGAAIGICEVCTWDLNDMGQHPRVYNISFINVTRKIHYGAFSRNSMLLDLDGSFSNKTTQNLIIQRYPHLTVPGSCIIPTSADLNNTLICPVDNGLIYCSLFIVKSDPVINLVLNVTNIGVDSLQKYPDGFGISQVVCQKLIDPDVFGWKFYLFSGFNYEFMFNGVPSFNGLKLQCSYSEPSYKEIWMKVYNKDAVSLSIDMKSTTGQTILSPDLVFNQSIIQYYYFNNDRKDLYMKLSYALFTSSTIEITAQKCSGGCPIPIKLWSDISTWTNKRLPLKGDQITIPENYRVLMDINPPLLDYLIIDGEVIFDEMLGNSELQANVIWIRKGRLRIGSYDKPFPYNAKIRVIGDKSNSFLKVDDNSNYRIQKSILVSGELYINALGRRSIRSILLNNALPGKNVINVENGTDWKENDVILIESSGFLPENEVFSIISINQENGMVILNDSLKYFHYGAINPTIFGDKTLEDRTSVHLLTRNVQLYATTTQFTFNQDNWGGGIRVFKYLTNTGKITLKNVEIRGFGKSTYMTNGQSPVISEPAIRFLSISQPCNIINTAIYESYGYGISIESSNMTQLINNTLYNQIQNGIQVIFSNNVYLANNYIISSIFDYNALEIKDKISIGLYFLMSPTLPLYTYNISIINNQVSLFIVGFSIPAQFCNDSRIISMNNSAHTNKKAFIFFFPSQSCSLISNLQAYKNEEALYSFYSTDSLIVKDLIVSDNKLAINLNKASNIDYPWSHFTNLAIIGVSKPECLDCFRYNSQLCVNFIAFQLTVTLAHAKNYPPDQNLINNWDFIDYFSSFDDQVYIDNTIISNFFNDPIYNCSGMTLFKTNKYASDYTSPYLLANVRRNNSKNIIFAAFDEPDPLWISPKYCGSMQCTGLKNFMIRDLTGSLFTKPSVLMPVWNNSIEKIENCQFLGTNNNSGLLCDGLNFAGLIIDSLDKDKMTRSLAPVIIENKDIGFKSQINGFMDHFYNLYSVYSYRYNRFPANVRVNQSYNVTFGQSPAVYTRVKLTGANPEDFVKIKIFFDVTTKKLMKLSYYNNGSNIATAKTINGSLEQEQRMFCGWHNFDSELKYVELYLTGEDDCVIQISVTNSIILQIKLEKELNKFLSNYSSFVDIITKYLNLKAENLKTLDIKSGSSVVTLGIVGSYANVSNDGIQNEKNSLLNTLSQLKDGIITGNLNLGSNVVSLNYTMSIQEDTVMSQGSSNIVNEAGSCNVSNSNININYPNNNNITILVITNNNTISSNNTNHIINVINSTNGNNSNISQKNITNQSNNTANINNNININNGYTQANNDNNNENSNKKIGIIIGSVFGGVILMIGLIVYIKRWVKNRQLENSNLSERDLEIVNRYYGKK